MNKNSKFKKMNLLEFICLKKMKNRQDFIKIIYKLKILSFNLLIKIAIKTHLENNTNNKIKLKIKCNQKL